MRVGWFVMFVFVKQTLSSKETNLFAHQSLHLALDKYGNSEINVKTITLDDPGAFKLGNMCHATYCRMVADVV